MANPSNKSIEIREALLYDVSGKSYNLTQAVTAFFYYEDIMSPFVTAIVNVIDSGTNLIGTLPIQGGEKFTIKIVDVQNKEFSYEMYVWKIYNRSFTSRIQTYNLALISKEALFNEGVRITEKLSGLPNQIVEKILKEYLDTDKEVMTETCKYQVNFFPNGKKAHAIIQSLMAKSVPQSSSAPGSEAKTKNKTGSQTKSSLPSDTQKTSGTAGYLFFENKDGFVFKPIDYFYSDGSDAFGGEEPVATYTSRPVDNAANKDNLFVIEEYKFNNEIDLIDQMRNGIFSTYMVYYNYATGAYEEYTYNLADSFDNMAHLGSQDKLGLVQKQLADRPTRIMSMILDHETWFDSEETGSPEKRDGEGSAPFPDYQKYYVAQSIARRYLMDNQKLEITVPGNSNLKVGDKIKVLLPNMVAQEERDKKKYDEEHSGTYLISKVSHNNVFLNSSTCTTKLELIRDTYGMKEYSSNVKS